MSNSSWFGRSFRSDNKKSSPSRIRLQFDCLEDRCTPALFLTSSELLATSAVALERWRATGLSAAQLQALESVEYQIADLGANTLGQYQPGLITIDDNAGSNLWFVDESPYLDEEFSTDSATGELHALTGSLAAGKIDLLTVLMHEQGHVLGLHDAADSSPNLLSETLEPGIRRLPFVGQAEHAVPGSITQVEYISTGLMGISQPFDNRMPYLAMNYAIAVTGVYPTRNLSANASYLGSVDLFAGNFAPTGWALCHGQILNISTNAALFSVIGAYYGGNGVTTFALPDLRGRVPIGAGQGPGLSNYLLGEVAGSEAATLSINNLPAHVHTNQDTGALTQPTGGSQPFDTRQPTLALNPIINLAGTFPQHNLSTDELLGSVTWFAGDYAPPGTVFAHGQLLSISTYPALYSVIGTVFGGNGLTTFALPDLRGRMAVGAGAGTGLSTVSLGEMSGSETTTLTTLSLPIHIHSIPGTVATTSLTGSSVPLSNRQPYLGMNFAINYYGMFPSRPLSSDHPTGETPTDTTPGAGFISGTEILDEATARPLISSIAEQALQHWRTAGISDAQFALLQSTPIVIGDLPSGALASAGDNLITLDRDAANRGWFVDTTPADDSEFDTLDPRTGEWLATDPAYSRHFDLLSTIMHEQGHILGLEHTSLAGSIMYGGLTVGARKKPTAADLVPADSPHEAGEFLEGVDQIMGSVGMFAGNFAPRDWLSTNGQFLAISSYTALFTVLGTNFGGNGVTNFQLPNTQGRAILGVGQAPGLSNYLIGDTGGQATVQLSVTHMPTHSHETNVRPAANDDTGATLSEDGANGTINVLANDTDADGNPSAPVNGVGQFTVDLDSGTTGVQTTVTYAEGVWSLNTATGVVTFDPANNFNGAAFLTYILADPAGVTDSATISFTVSAVNDTPIANDDVGSTLSEDGANGTINILTNDTDVEGNPSAPVNGVGQFTVDLDTGTAGVQTTVTNAQGVWSLNTATGVVTFDPADNFNGGASLTYTLADPAGVTDPASISFTVSAVNDPPVANDDTGATLSEDGVAGTIRILSNDTDPDSTPSTPVRLADGYTVDLDTGTSGVQSSVTNAQGVWIFHIIFGDLYYQPATDFTGTASLTYLLIDPEGLSDSASISFTVTAVNDAPVANDDVGPALTEDGANGTFNILTNDTDVEGNPTAPVNGAGQFTVDLDTGTVGVQTTITDTQGVWTFNTSTGVVTFDPANNFSGSASRTYSLTDPTGASDTATLSFVVTSVNDSPVANDDIGSTLTEDGVAGTIRILSNDTDPDSTPSTPVSLADGYTVDLDTGTSGVQSSVTNAQGVWIFHIIFGDLYYRPATNFNGTASLTYLLIDPEGLSDSASISFTVTAVNDAPVANDDVGPALTEDGANGTINILTNDTDADGNPTAPVNGVGQFIVDLDTSTVGVQTTITDAQGVWTLNTSTGVVTFDPADNFNGAASLTYTLADSVGLTDTATISFTVSAVNDTPIANDDVGSALSEDGANGTINILTNDTDADGNPTAPVNGIGQFTVDLDSGTTGVQTTVTNVQGVWTLNTTTGVVTFDPADNFNGAASLTYTLADSVGLTDSATISFTVSAVNDTPIANDDVGSTLSEDGANGTINILTNDTDLEGNPSAPVNGVGQFTVDLDTGTAGVQTTITNDQGEWTLNTSTGVVTFDPTHNYHGSASLTYVLTDLGGASDTATIRFAVSPVNDPPVVNDDIGPSLTENGENGDVTALANDSDPDGSLTPPVNQAGRYIVDLDPVAVGTQTTVTNAQGVWTLNTGTGIVTFDPAHNFNGLAALPYTVADQAGAIGTGTMRFVVTPVNDLPEANDDVGPTLIEDGANGRVSIIANDTDADGNPTLPLNILGQFSIDLSSVSVGLQASVTDTQGVWTFDIATGDLTFDPAHNFSGTASLTYTLTDPAGANDTAVVTFTVIALPPTNATYGDSLYRLVLQRTPSEGEVQGWANRLNTGGTRQETATVFWRSAEHRATQINSYYRDILGREANARDLSNWVQVMLAGATEEQVMHGFLNSAEFRNQFATPSAYIAALYSKLLKRTASEDETARYVAILNDQTRARIITAFIESDERHNLLIREGYQSYLGRAADPVGSAGWLNALRAGLSDGNLAIALLASSESFSYS